MSMNEMAKFPSLLQELGIEAATPVESLLLREYGAVFAVQGAAAPPYIIFPDESAVWEFQSGVESATALIGGLEITLQESAMTELLAAVEEGESLGLSVTPRGPDSGARDYAGTVDLWASRVEPALEHWSANGRISVETAETIRNSSPFDQVSMVLELEREGIFFAKDLSKSIIYSVAPPGASQHLAMLAFDVAEYYDAEVRSVLVRHGWFQTVTSDLPHFTFLGADESELPGLGLKRIENGDRHFWVPDI
jgi:hypothetical protein